MAVSYEMYQEQILDHYKHPRNKGSLPGATKNARDTNPLCGDEVVLHLKVDGSDRIADVRFEGQGCAISQASASMLTTIVKGMSLRDATSGNTGIALAMLGASEGYQVTLCVPANVNAERKKVLQAYGAKLVLTPAAEGTDGAQKAAKALVASKPETYWYLDQYNNEANWRAHFESTGPEIWDQTRGTITHFVACLGTTGTFVGAGRYLKKMAPRVRLVGVQPDSPFHGLEGVKHLEP